METKVSYTVAGIFVLSMITAIVIAIIWLSSGLNSDEYKKYQVFMTEAISGLSLDAPVEFNGVKVGKIYKIQINHKNPQLVNLIIRIKSDTPVTMGTRAKLGMRALTGVGYLLLEDKGTDMHPLIEAGDSLPVIPTTPSIFVRLDTILTQLTDSFKQVSASIRSFLNEENLRSFKQILHSSQGSLNIIEKQTLPQTNQTISNFGNLANDLSSVSSEIKQNPSVLIRGKQPRIPGPGEKQ